MIYTDEIKEKNLDQFFDWVGENKFDEFSTHEDRYEEDLENYIGDILDKENDKLWKEYFITLTK